MGSVRWVWRANVCEFSSYLTSRFGIKDVFYANRCVSMLKCGDECDDELFKVCTTLRTDCV